MPQFITVFCVLAAVIVISQLVRLSEILVTFGLSLENILLPFLFILMPFLSIIVPIALMFAILLSFSRISADGEFTAMLASGYSLRRALSPVLTITTVAYIISAVGSIYFESWGRRETLEFYHRKTQTELDNMIRYRMKPGVFLDDFLGYVLYAEHISADRSRFENVMLAPGKESQSQHFTLLAPAASITGSVEHGDLRMSFDYGIIYATKADSEEVSVIKFKRSELDLLAIFRDQIFGSGSAEDDFRGYTPSELSHYIDSQKDSKDRDTYLKARFLFHQRMSMPFACFTFALFAMVFGIQDDRRGKNHAFLGACLTIVMGYIVTMSFKFLSEKGQISAPLGAWLPHVLLTSFAAALVYQKNRLPPSESIFDLRHIPLVRKLIRRTKI
ncbi:MAG: LptF/LptG family permease, partial [Proteobacteria bacterium]|nr:LptF/LptG family permease [Pseudomonadota bacterium]